MKRRRLIIAPEERRDLLDIEHWVTEATSARVAEAFLARIFAYFRSLESASERGHRRDDIRSGMRIVGFERRLTIAFAAHEERVEVLRVFRAGRDWESDLAED